MMPDGAVVSDGKIPNHAQEYPLYVVMVLADITFGKVPVKIIC
jgi:hypothetical protein